MIRIFLILFISLSSNFAYSSKFVFSLKSSLYSKILTGVDTDTQTEGEIVSNSNLNFGFQTEYSMSNSLRFLFDYTSRSVSFDNTDNVINGNTDFDTSSMRFGIKWIAFARTAFRFLYTIEQDVGFEVVNSKAEIFTENSSYLTLYYDQIVFLGKSIYSGFRAGIDILGTGVELTERSATRYGAFVTLNTSYGQFETFYELKNITKDSSTLSYEESDSILHLYYRLTF